MMRFAFWQRWLLVVSLVVVLFGLALATLNDTSAFDLAFGNRVNAAIFRSGPVTTEMKAFQRWIYGVLGATVAGWGAALTFIAVGPFRRKELWSWNCLAVSLILWFVVDTTISLVFNVAINVVFNTTLLIALALPLVFARKHFWGRG
jgi:hypothetical protein